MDEHFLPPGTASKIKELLYPTQTEAINAVEKGERGELLSQGDVDEVVGALESLIERPGEVSQEDRDRARSLRDTMTEIV